MYSGPSYLPNNYPEVNWLNNIFDCGKEETFRITEYGCDTTYKCRSLMKDHVWGGVLRWGDESELSVISRVSIS